MPGWRGRAQLRRRRQWLQLLQQRWRLVTSWAKGSAGPGTTADRLAARITAATDGKIDVRVLGAGELTSPFGVLDAVIDGAAEMAHTASFFWAGRVPAASYFTTMPFGLSPLAHSAWVRFGGGQALWDEAYAPLEVKPLMAGNSGANMAGWFKAPLQSLASLGGVKIRTAGLGGEIYLAGCHHRHPALDRDPQRPADRRDRRRRVPRPFSDRSLGFDQVAAHHYFPASTSRPAVALINANLCQPERRPARGGPQRPRRRKRHRSPRQPVQRQALAALREGSTRIEVLPGDIVEAARAASVEVLADYADTDAMTRRVDASYRSALDALSGWGRLNQG